MMFQLGEVLHSLYKFRRRARVTTARLTLLLILCVTVESAQTALSEEPSPSSHDPTSVEGVFSDGDVSNSVNAPRDQIPGLRSSTGDSEGLRPVTGNPEDPSDSESLTDNSSNFKDLNDGKENARELDSTTEKHLRQDHETTQLKEKDEDILRDPHSNDERAVPKDVHPDNSLPVHPPSHDAPSSDKQSSSRSRSPTSEEKPNPRHETSHRTAPQHDSHEHLPQPYDPKISNLSPSINHSASTSHEASALELSDDPDFSTPLLHKSNPDTVHDNHYRYCVRRSEYHTQHGVHVTTWRWDEIRSYYALVLFIIIAGLAKLAFHNFSWLSSKLPESCLLIILGVLMGVLTYHLRKFSKKEEFPRILLQPGKVIDPCYDGISGFLPKFDSEMFFLILLPPIVLEAAYSLHDRAFASNLWTILIYAVVGTILNMFIIGPTLYALAHYGLMGAGMYPLNTSFDIKKVSVVEIMTFSSLIVAVDPVAVLAIFQEVGVNKDLYFLVFGESLLNDAVTVVLYNAMVAFTGSQDHAPESDQILMAVAAFFAVSLGGLAIGVAFGIVTAIVTRFTSDVPVIEPLSLLMLSYLAYLTAELVHFSGIIATVGCGIVQAHYAMKNISKNSYITIKYFIGMASSISDTIIFMFLGMVLVSDEHRWHTGFCLWTLALCLLVRFAVTYTLTAIANRFRMQRIGKKEQFIMAYGGLRGAVGFSLVVMLYDTSIDKETVNVFVTCTLFIVLFTVFIQGSTIKMIVSVFRIKLEDHEEKTLVEEIVGSSLDHMVSGIEEVVGHGVFSRLKERLEKLDEAVLSRWLVVSSNSSAALTEIYDKLVLEEHYANLYGTAAVLESMNLNAGEKYVTPSIDQNKLQEKAAAANQSMARRISNAANLPLPEEEKVWLQRVASIRRGRIQDSRKSSILPFDTPLVTVTSSDTQGYGRRGSILETMRQGMGRRLSVSLLQKTDADVESGGRQTVVQPSGHVMALRQAFRDNPFNKFNQRYNRNLIDEDERQLETHLRRRRMNARRVSQMALVSLMPEEASEFQRGVPERHSLGIQKRKMSPLVRNRSHSLEATVGNDNPNESRSSNHSKSDSRTGAGQLGYPYSRSPSSSLQVIGNSSAPRPNHGYVITEESDCESDRTTNACGNCGSSSEGSSPELLRISNGGSLNESCERNNREAPSSSYDVILRFSTEQQRREQDCSSSISQAPELLTSNQTDVNDTKL